MMTTLSPLRHAAQILASLVLVSMLAGCSSVFSERRPVPEQLVSKARVFETNSDTPIRYWGDEPEDENGDTRVQLLVQKSIRQVTNSPRVDLLSLSGGGYNGAFGVGYLLGWSDAGTRPEFRVVTGISVGALIAPYAFLGKDYDQKLLNSLVKIVTEKTSINFFDLIFGAGGLEDAHAIRESVASIITPETLAAIAREQSKGRRLLIGTTNIDAERPVVWDIGAIASSSMATEDKVALVRLILLASSAVPGVYPPVLINVEADGKVYDELHVDGGVTQNLVLLPTDLDLAKSGSSTRNIYVIYNGQIAPTYDPVTGATFDLLRRAVPTFLKYLGIGDIRQLQVAAKRYNAKFHVISIPKDVTVKDEFPPDIDYVDKLLKLGYKLGNEGTWQVK